MNCEKCGKPCELKPRKFAYHDGTFFTGYVCVDCNALYENEEDSIFKYDIKKQKEREKEVVT